MGYRQVSAMLGKGAPGTEGKRWIIPELCCKDAGVTSRVHGCELHFA